MEWQCVQVVVENNVDLCLHIHSDCPSLPLPTHQDSENVLQSRFETLQRSKITQKQINVICKAPKQGIKAFQLSYQYTEVVKNISYFLNICILRFVY